MHAHTAVSGARIGCDRCAPWVAKLWVAMPREAHRHRRHPPGGVGAHVILRAVEVRCTAKRGTESRSASLKKITDVVPDCSTLIRNPRLWVVRIGNTLYRKKVTDVYHPRPWKKVTVPPRPQGVTQCKSRRARVCRPSTAAAHKHAPARTCTHSCTRTRARTCTHTCTAAHAPAHSKHAPAHSTAAAHAPAHTAAHTCTHSRILHHTHAVFDVDRTANSRPHLTLAASHHVDPLWSHPSSTRPPHAQTPVLVAIVTVCVCVS